MMRESNKASKLGMMASLAGVIVLGVAGLLGIHDMVKDLGKKENQKYSVFYKDSAFYTALAGSALGLGGLGVLAYDSAKKDKCLNPQA